LLKAAARIGQPPTAVIFNDPSHTKWTEWDYKLIKAHFLKEDWYRDGIPIWVDESERVTFDVKGRVSKSRAAIERAQEADNKKKKTTPGKYYVAEPRVMDGGEMPTRQEWMDEQARKQGFKIPDSDRRPNIVQGKKTS
jgi:hypothetical protein